MASYTACDTVSSLPLSIGQGCTHSVRWLSGVVCPIDVSITRTGEGGGNPGILVLPIPHSYASTASSVHARRNSAIIVPGLLSQSSSSRRQAAEPNVNLGLVNAHTLIGEGLHCRLLRGSAWGGANNEVGLEADGVNLDALSLNALDYITSGGVLGARRFDVVVVVDELNIGANGFGGGRSELECLIGMVSSVGGMTGWRERTRGMY